MKKLIATSLLTLVIFMSPLFMVNVSAANAPQACLEGTGPGTNIPCHVCYYNQYGICIPVLGLTDNKPNFSTETFLLSAGLLSSGVLFLINGKFLKNKFYSVK